MLSIGSTKALLKSIQEAAAVLQLFDLCFRYEVYRVKLHSHSLDQSFIL